MNHFTKGFGDELTKVAVIGALGSLGKFVMKRPLTTLGLGGIGLSTAMAAKAGRERGRRGGEEPRHLHAGRDPLSGQTYASPAAYTNFNKLMKNPRAERKENKRVSKHYKEKLFRG